MHIPSRPGVHKLTIVFVLLSLMLPAFAAAPVSAQGEECPEGLVYLPADDFCVLLEDVPPGAEFIDQHADDGESNSGDSSDEQPVEDEQAPEEDVDDPVVEDEQPVDDAVEGEDPGQIRNITLVTYPCPINWNPATREIEESHDMCTVPPVTAMSYTILYEGQSMLEVAVQTDADLAKDLGLNGIPLPAGMWTIQEKQQDGLTDPFAFCAIYAADGTERMRVNEIIPGGKLDILLAEGEEVNCEWFSVAAVPETTGDPNALPIGGLTLEGRNCPYGTSDSWTVEFLLKQCVDKGLAPIEYAASLNGTVVSNQLGPTDDFLVDFQNGLDTRLLSGSWKITPSYPAEYEKSYIYCSITSAIGGVSDVEPETFFSEITLELKPDDRGSCLWFNVESEPRTGAALGITLLLHTCPEGFNQSGGDYNTCILPLQEPISFDFIKNGQLMETGTATAPDSQLPLKMTPEAGEWEIRPIVAMDRIEPGWACWAELSTGEKVLGITYASLADGNGVQPKFGPNHNLVCDVWIFSGVVSNIIQITAHTCPDGFDAANPAAGDKFASCPIASGLTFDFQIDGTSVQKDVSDRNGVASIPVTPGLLRIVATPPEGFGPPFVVCDHTTTGGNSVQTVEETINADGRSITVELDADSQLTCDWFNLTGALPLTETDEEALGDSDVSVEPGDTEGPADSDEAVGTSFVTIQQWDCPPSMSAADSQSDLLISCQSSPSDAALTLTDSAGTIEDNPGTDAANWSDVQPGEVTISGENSSESLVFCSSSTLVDGEMVDVFPEQVDAAEGQILILVEPGSEVYCDWFNPASE